MDDKLRVYQAVWNMTQQILDPLVCEDDFDQEVQDVLMDHGF